MKSVQLKDIVRTAIPFALVAILGGCAREKQTQAAAPSSLPPFESLGTTNMQPAPAPVPNTPTAANIYISADILKACNISDKNAYFGFDSSQLTKFDHAALDQVATCFSSGPLAGQKIRLVGHADPRGTSEYNMTLGQSRADAVAAFLANHGVSDANTHSTSRGAQDATGTDDTGWAHDRRVDVMLDR